MWAKEWLCLLLPLLVVTGCQVVPDAATSRPADHLVYKGFSSQPRLRFGSYPSSTLGTTFLGKDLGSHGYHYRLSEKDGIVYTCKAGHIDIIHVRIAADWTAYLIVKTFTHIMNNDAGFTYKLEADRSRYFVKFSYPENWATLSEKEKELIARDIAGGLGQYLAFTTTTWHEILTWFGFKCLGVFPEFPSAFSWEESFSNLLGTALGAQAIQDSANSYDEAMTIALDKEMEKLGIQPASVAKKAADQVKGKWFTGSTLFLVDMKRRNFDIGLDDGFVTPTLVPDITACVNVAPMSYPVPSPEILSKYGFSIKLEIEPREWEKNKILKVVYGSERRKYIEPAIHFAPIMDYIKKEAVEKYGYLCDPY